MLRMGGNGEICELGDPSPLVLPLPWQSLCGTEVLGQSAPPTIMFLMHRALNVEVLAQLKADPLLVGR